jgi:hypothetical protein
LLDRAVEERNTECLSSARRRQEIRAQRQAQPRRSSIWGALHPCADGLDRKTLMRFASNMAVNQYSSHWGVKIRQPGVKIRPSKSVSLNRAII